MDMSQYQDLFITESRKHLAALKELSIRIEEDVSDRAVVEEMFRHAHSLKGMAATMQFDAIATLVFRMENLLGRVRSNEIAFCPALADLLLEGQDLLSGMVSVIENGAGEPQDAARLIQRLETFTPDP